MKRVLVTGASGFVGSSLLAHLGASGFQPMAALRRSTTRVSPAVPRIQVGDLLPDTDWTRALEGVEFVVHAAARVHVMNEQAADPLREFRRVNVDGTLSLARQAVAAGVKRFVFISSIGVNGACTAGEPFSEVSRPAPHADYALSKLEAEQGLLELVKTSSMELVIIRPPLVYAGHAPGNFKRLLQLVGSGLPLPFASVHNQRSMISLDNLVGFISLCLEHPGAANELFLISDGTDVSTPEIIRHLAAGMERKARLLPVPDSLMHKGARFLGREAMYIQLCGSLSIDSSKARNMLGWTPMLTAEQALRKAGRDYQQLVTSHA